ncbi:SGNH/GDSL hydrolase family protein [Nocardia tengchongensis]|uniref:SGNH/GDSL hydrolase family protein n=1 Tax=Nocardia tengchongensis TaxID=2055889 RepID=UPI00340DD173
MRSPRSRTIRHLAAATTLTTAALTCVAGQAAADPPTGDRSTQYYLALGDSLAAGYQTLPGSHNYDHYLVGQGYPQDIARTLGARAQGRGQGFEFTDLGCPGESTHTMIAGGCGFEHPYTEPQLTVAEEFLRTHHDDNVVVTLDIGANDADRCALGGRFDIECALTGIHAMGPNLDLILDGLQAAAGPHTRIVAMNLYDPFLAKYLEPEGKPLAAATLPLVALMNSGIADALARHAIPIADVSAAFDTNAVMPMVAYGDQQVPLNVSRIMEWTNMSRNDIHANDAGYQVIADTFLPLLP